MPPYISRDFLHQTVNDICIFSMVFAFISMVNSHNYIAAGVFSLMFYCRYIEANCYTRHNDVQDAPDTNVIHADEVIEPEVEDAGPPKTYKRRIDGKNIARRGKFIGQTRPITRASEDTDDMKGL